VKKPILQIILIIFLLFGPMVVFSGDEYNEPVLVEAMNFKVETAGRVLEFSWLEYLRDDFQWYKLVRSARDANPVYPNAETIFVGTESDQTSFRFVHNDNKKYFYRLTIVTKGRDRWVSPVFEFDPETSAPVRPPGPQDFGGRN
jgi:hypothetical protein